MSRSNAELGLKDDVTLFQGAADNPYYALFFNAIPAPGAENVPKEVREVDLRPDREVRLHVEIFNPNGTYPLIVTPGGMGDCTGFGNFARNIASTDSDLMVIIWDRRNLGRSEINWGSENLVAEEGEDLHHLIRKVVGGPATLYGMSAGARINMIVAARYPEDVAALVIAPLTGGPIASSRLSEEYYLKYHMPDKYPFAKKLETMEDVGKTPLWSAYLERNKDDKYLIDKFYAASATDFLAAMKRTGQIFASYRHTTCVSIPDDQVFALKTPATLLFHHGEERDELHPVYCHRSATTLFNNASFHVVATLEPLCELMNPFIKKYTPPRRTAPSNGGSDGGAKPAKPPRSCLVPSFPFLNLNGAPPRKLVPVPAFCEHSIKYFDTGVDKARRPVLPQTGVRKPF